MQRLNRGDDPERRDARDIFGMDSFIFWKFEKDQRASERALRLCVGWREGPGDFVAWRSRRTEVSLLIRKQQEMTYPWRIRGWLDWLENARLLLELSLQLNYLVK